ncbi:MAG: nucleotidyltransferase domain-containing protein [Ignavibacteriae bacterium]|nr:nucleotidyltransferase domain-containing protein [Ignavibacteriota bacterium]
MPDLKAISLSLQQWVHTHPEVDAIWLFGSWAKGSANEHSDIDVAILFSRDSIPSSYERLDLMTSLTDRLGGDVDLVVLNTAGELITQQILSRGLCLFSRSPTRTALYRLAEQGKYQDFEIIMNAIVAATKARAHG